MDFVEYRFNVGDSCCQGSKMTIYKVTNGIKEAIEVEANFVNKEKAAEYAVKRIEEIKNGK